LNNCEFTPVIKGNRSSAPRKRKVLYTITNQLLNASFQNKLNTPYVTSRLVKSTKNDNTSYSTFYDVLRFLLLRTWYFYGESSMFVFRKVFLRRKIHYGHIMLADFHSRLNFSHVPLTIFVCTAHFLH
jgi:hypothetical protein